MHSTLILCCIVKVKVKFILQRVSKAQKGEQMYSSTRSLTLALDGVSGQLHDLAGLPLERTCTII